MALKKQISKAEFDALSPDLKTEYKASGENFVLDLVGDDGIDWQQKRNIEADHRKKAEDRAKKAEEERDNLRRGAIPKDDVAALESSWATKLSDLETNLKGQLASRDAVIGNLTVDHTARDLASKISTVPDLILPHIRQRLATEVTDGRAGVRVLDMNGKPSALSIDDLANEFKQNPAYATVLIGSKASGGGGGGNNGGGATKKLKEMTEAERVALYKQDPAAFNQLVAQQSQQ